MMLTAAARKAEAGVERMERVIPYMATRPLLFAESKREMGRRGERMMKRVESRASDT
jgi:hypothetical protein